jgi:hypothetical protein
MSLTDDLAFLRRTPCNTTEILIFLAKWKLAKIAIYADATNAQKDAVVRL